MLKHTILLISEQDLVLSIWMMCSVLETSLSWSTVLTIPTTTVPTLRTLVYLVAMLVAPRETSDWLVVAMTLKAELRFAPSVAGAQCVMTLGEP